MNDNLRSARLWAAVVFVLSVALGLVSNVAASQIPEPLKPFVGYAWPMLLVLGLILVFIQWRSGPGRQGPPSHAVSEFNVLWPKLAANLKHDLAMTKDAIKEAFHAAELDYTFPTDLVQIPNRLFYELHWRTISQYDAEFWQAIAKYIKLAQALRQAKTAYNQLVYADRVEGDEFHDAKAIMHKSALELEDVVYHWIEPFVERYEAIMPKSA